MSVQITTAFVEQYKANVLHLAQQKGSRLRDAVRTETVTGKAHFFERIGSTAAEKRASRHSDTPRMDTPHSRRKVSLDDYDWADLIDNEDKVRMLISPHSEYAMAGAWAMGRAMDDAIIAAATGTAYSGVAGGTSVSLPSGQNYSPDSYTKIQENYIYQIRKIEQQNSIEDLSNDINQSREQFIINSGDTVRTFDAFFPSGDNLGSMPMVIIMHGLGGSTTDMQGLNSYFLNLGVVPVYPQALYYENLPTVGSTTIFNYGVWPELYDDVAFVSDIIELADYNHDGVLNIFDVIQMSDFVTGQ